MPNMNAGPIPILPPEHTATQLGTTTRLRECETDRRFLEVVTAEGKTVVALLKRSASAGRGE